MNKILKRLTEPSTYAGIAAFAAAIGIGFADQIPELGENIAYIVMGVAGIVAMFGRDPGSSE